MQLTVQYAAPRRGVPHRRSVERWLRAALRRDADITVRFVDAREGRRINARYRARPYATNVLSFDYRGELPGSHFAGDIVLCAPVVAREARRDGKELSAHYAHLVVHGALHLQGYDHDRKRDARRMEGRERTILAGLGYADPYVLGTPGGRGWRSAPAS